MISTLSVSDAVTLRVLSQLERSNLSLCNMTKNPNEFFLKNWSVLKMMKEVSEQSKPIENKIANAYTGWQKPGNKNTANILRRERSRV